MDTPQENPQSLCKLMQRLCYLESHIAEMHKQADEDVRNGMNISRERRDYAAEMLADLAPIAAKWRRQVADRYWLDRHGEEIGDR